MDQIDSAGWQALAALASTAVALGAALGGFLSWRARGQRREEVHAWANAGIEALQSLVLLAGLQPEQIEITEARRRLWAVTFATSILTEQGRLFFRNKPAGKLGITKARAYRGRRPAILDALIAGHNAALALPTANAEMRARLSLVVEDALKSFVTLVQYEVGRSRSANPAAGRPGDSIDLQRLLAAQDPMRVASRLEGR